MKTINEMIKSWYEKRVREIESLSGLVSHALTLATLAIELGVSIPKLHNHLTTLNMLLYERGIDDVDLNQLENMSTLEVCETIMRNVSVIIIKSYLFTCSFLGLEYY